VVADQHEDLIVTATREACEEIGLPPERMARWGDGDNGTLQLLEWAVADGHAGQVMLGMDAARQGYYRAFGGSPGLRFLLGEFSDVLEERGIGAEIRKCLFVDNPARAFAFAVVAR